MSTPKTRHASSSHISNYLGPGKELVPSQVPTDPEGCPPACLAPQGREDEDGGGGQEKLSPEWVNDCVAVMGQWEQANPQFRPLIICQARSMERKLVKEWEKTILAARNMLGKSLKTELESKLDILG